MSQESPEETQVLDPAAPPSPDDNEPQDPAEGEMNRPDDGDHGLGYDFEVKEQDRWLPIANGECEPAPSLLLLLLFAPALRPRCTSTDAGCLWRWTIAA